MEKILIEYIDKFFDETVKLRRHLHKYPELAYEEANTTQYLTDLFPKSWKISRIDGMTGFVADLVLHEQLPTLIFRSELDALPIKENVDVDYASVNEGVMHACGHDMHTAILFTLAKIFDLELFNSRLKYNLRLIFQPGEELLPGGARQFIEKGVLSDINPVAAFALHLSPELKTGQVGVYDGPFMASGDEIHVKVVGKGGHAALMSNNIDPIVIASKLVLFIRELNNMDLSGNPHIAVIGDFQALGSTNITPDCASLKGTMRTFSESDRVLLKTKIRDFCVELEQENNCKIELDIKEGYPSLINNHGIVERISATMLDFVGNEEVVSIPRRMTTDDFAYFSHQIPSCMMRLGCDGGAGEEHEVGKLHSSRFFPDEKAMKVGVKVFAMLALNY